MNEYPPYDQEFLVGDYKGFKLYVGITKEVTDKNNGRDMTREPIKTAYFKMVGEDKKLSILLNKRKNKQGSVSCFSTVSQELEVTNKGLEAMYQELLERFEPSFHSKSS